MQSRQLEKASASTDQRGMDGVVVDLLVQRKGLQLTNGLGSAKAFDAEVVMDGAKDMAIVIQVLTVHLEVLFPLRRPTLMGSPKAQTAHLTAPVTQAQHVAVRLEQGPQQVVGDLADGEE